MLIRPEQEALIGQVFESYLTQHHEEDILQFIAVTNEEIHCPVFVNAMTLFETNMEVADYFNAYPHDVLSIFDKVLQKTALKFSEKSFPKPSNHQIVKRCPHTRITGLPVCPEMTREVIPRSRDVGRFLSVTGTVIRTSATKVLEYEREYICTKCHYVLIKQADFEQFYSFTQQMSCPNPIGCNSNKFSSLNRDSEPATCRDYQEIKIQEQVQRLSVGNVPRSLVVVLEDDLADSCKSGDDVTVYGVICQRWKPLYDGTPCNVELVLKANNIEVTNRSDQQTSCLALKDLQKEYEDFWNSYKHFPITGRNCILLSLCPQIFGMYIIKLAVAMVLAGGVQRIDSSGTKVRGECHMLLVGDPGTGKSQFLKYAAKIIPRSILTTGIGSTSAGLTVAAVKDGNDWHLEAGALVLADGGLCCIDEFNSIKEHERISIHEAMEQQSISVAKAGIVCKLNTRTSILAATNPKGQLNPNEPLSVGIALASPLLSRFDLVLVLMDNRNPEWDRIISSFILEDRELCSESADLWTMDKMKTYFSVIKQLQPQMSEDANSILTRYYQLQRQTDGRNAARTTIRMLESLSRLSEAHSRLMYREMVTIEDAVMAVSVMECSMQGGTLLGNINALFMPFPADPFEQYKTQCQRLLEELNLPVLLQKELGRLERLRNNASAVSPSSDKCEPRGPTMTTSPYHHDISSEDQEDPLDSFHSNTPSLLGRSVRTNLPVDSPTHDPLKNNTSFQWLTANNLFKGPNVKNILSYSDSTSVLSTDSNILLHPSAAFLSPSEDQTIGKEEKMGGVPSRTQEQTEQEKKATDSGSVRCVIQTIPKNVRDRGFKEQKQQQQCDTEQRERENDAVSHGQKAPTDPSLSNKEKKKKTSENIITHSVPRQKMGGDLLSKLSAFKFKARKVPIYNHNSGSQQDTQRCPAGCSFHSSSGRKRKHSSNDSEVRATLE